MTFYCSRINSNVLIPNARNDGTFDMHFPNVQSKLPLIFLKKNFFFLKSFESHSVQSPCYMFMHIQ